MGKGVFLILLMWGKAQISIVKNEKVRRQGVFDDTVWFACICQYFQSMLLIKRPVVKILIKALISLVSLGIGASPSPLDFKIIQRCSARRGSKRRVIYTARNQAVAIGRPSTAEFFFVLIWIALISVFHSLKIFSPKILLFPFHLMF